MAVRGRQADGQVPALRRTALASSHHGPDAGLRHLEAWHSFMKRTLQLVRWHSSGHHNPCVLQVLPTSSWQGALQALMACAATMAVWACVFQPLAADARSLFGNPWSSPAPSSSTPATLEMKVGISLCTTGPLQA